MSSPIVVNGSTTIISVRANNFVYDSGTVAVVLLSSINSFGRMITIFDEDGVVGGPLSKRILISTTRNVTFDSGQPQGGGAGDFKFFLTQKNQSLSVFPRSLNQWVLPQTVIKSQLDTENCDVVITGTDFSAIQAQIIGVSTNLEVYGSTISGTQLNLNRRIYTAFGQDSLTVNAIKSILTSTGAITVGQINTDSSGLNDLAVAGNIQNTTFINASTISTFTQTASSLITNSLIFTDYTNEKLSLLNLVSLSTIWNGSNLSYGTASTFSSGLLKYSTSLQLLSITAGVSSISSIVPNAVSSISGSEGLSSYSTAFINFINSINYGPGVSSLSTVINQGLSSFSVGPSLSTLSSVISRGLSSVNQGPGISSLYIYFGERASSVATNFGTSSLSTSISLGLSTVNTTLAFSNVSTLYSIGVSDIANYTGISSLSTLVPLFFSSLILQGGVSSLSTYVFSTLSSLVVGPGLSSLSTTTGNYFSSLYTPYGLSSLSTTFSGLSTQSVRLGLSSLSSVISRGLSTVSIFGSLSTISTTFAVGFSNIEGTDGISSLSTFTLSTLSSLNSSQGASSLFRFIRNQFSTLSDQEGISTFSSFIGPAFSSIISGKSLIYPANLSTSIINVSTLLMWDSTNSVYRNLNISANKLYINTTLIDTFVIQSTSRSTIAISSYNINIAGSMNASTLFGTSLFIDPRNNSNSSTFASTVSTGLLTTSSLTTSSITFNIGVSPLYVINGDLRFNMTSITQLSSLGSSSLSTTMSALSSLQGIMPMPFSNMSTALSRGASTMNFGQGVSTLSTFLSQASTFNFFPGISTNNFIASTALISTISSFGQISTFLTIDTLLNVSSLITSTLIACNVDIGILNLPKAFVSSFIFVNNSVSTAISSLSTLVTGSGISTGTITIFSPTASTFASSVTITNEMRASTIILSTLLVPNFGTGPAVMPFVVNSGAIFLNGSNIAGSALDPNDLGRYGIAVSTANLYASTIIASSIQTSMIKVAQKMIVDECVEVVQSSLTLYNRTVLSSFIDTVTSEPTQYFDVIQYSTDGFNWKQTNWFQSSIGMGIGSILSKPSYNGIYWLVGNYKNSIPNGDPGNNMNNYNNSVMYSPDGYSYFGLENNQFSVQAYSPTWNGQYWLAGDAYNSATIDTIKRSVDGLIWRSATSGGFDLACQNFGWNGWLWVAVGLATTTSNIQYSTDGFNWSNAQGSLPEGSANSVLFDGKKWIVGGSFFTSFVYSSDGINWLASPTSDCNAIHDIAYNGRIYIAAGEFSNASYGLAYSYDGINWTYNNTLLPSPYNMDYPLDGGAWSVTWSGDRFVAAGSNSFSNLSGVYSFDGLTWIPADTNAIPDRSLADWGQGTGFSSNILPAVETNNLKIHTMSKGYIPLYLTSTNHWQVTPSSIIMNNNFTINKELGSDKRIGIGTPYPLATLDIAGTMMANNSTFFSSIVIGSSFGYNGSTLTKGFDPTFDVTIFGSSLMNSLVINTPAGVPRFGPLDVYSPNLPIINRGAYLDLSTFTSTMVNINQVASFPQSGRRGISGVDDSSVYWMWNNGPAEQQSSLYFSLTGTSFFTGQHACYVSSVTQENVSSFVGLIVAADNNGYVSVDMNGNVKEGSNAIWSTECLPRVALTTMDMQKSAFGVISDKENLPAAVNFSTLNSAYDIQAGFRNALYGRLLVNGVGDGALWTTNVNGNVFIGDYLCSSAIPGHARVQDDNECMYNYTVAKATMNCDFDVNSSNYRCEPIDYNGSTFLRAFIGVSYHCS
jgi:hypothetical protein